jgi:hypothetical protein
MVLAGVNVTVRRAPLMGVAPGALCPIDRAMLVTSSAGSGGRQRAAFSAKSAASIAAGVIPRLRIEPAKLVNVVLRSPAGIT